MRIIECQGTPFDIGHTHGSHAADLIRGSIAFYATLFQSGSAQSWAQVRQIAARFHTPMLEKWPAYADEMRGIASGACVSILDIVALNVRTEIAFGLRTAPLSDGCTSVYYRFPEGASAVQGQNWDWQREQAANLVYLTIHPAEPGLPRIKMITEAGIIGKIGINSHGVGVCFNALSVPGVDYKGLPAHLALRVALESASAEDAQRAIMEKSGGGRMASCAFILIGCRDGAVGCEFAATVAGSGGVGCVWQRVESLREPGQGDMLVHTNNCVLAHPQSNKERASLPDSPVRLGHMRDLIQHHAAHMNRETFASLFEDEQNYPCSINRKQEGESGIESLFNIVMEFSGGPKGARASVKVGRPTEASEELAMEFD